MKRLILMAALALTAGLAGPALALPTITGNTVITVDLLGYIMRNMSVTVFLGGPVSTSAYNQPAYTVQPLPTVLWTVTPAGAGIFGGGGTGGSVTQGTVPWSVSPAGAGLFGGGSGGAVTQSTSPWIVSQSSDSDPWRVEIITPIPLSSSAVDQPPFTVQQAPGALFGITGTVAVNQNTSPWTVSLTGNTAVTVTANPATVFTISPTGLNYINALQGTSPWIVSQSSGSNPWTVSDTGTVPKTTQPFPGSIWTCSRTGQEWADALSHESTPGTATHIKALAGDLSSTKTDWVTGVAGQTIYIRTLASGFSSAGSITLTVTDSVGTVILTTYIYGMGFFGPWAQGGVACAAGKSLRIYCNASTATSVAVEYWQY